MSYVIADPETLATAAADVAGIGSAISDANSAAAGPTAGVLAPAGDEVSAAAASLFRTYAQDYQAVLTQAAAFHDEFAQALATAGTAYTNAEAASTALVSGALGALNAPAEALLGRPLIGSVGSSGIGGVPSMGGPASQGQLTALIMGYTGVAWPPSAYMTAVQNAYIQPFFPGATQVPQFTPEQFWPVTPNLGDNLTFGQSVALGIPLLDAGIKAQIALGQHVVVFAYSQSSTVATDEMIALGALPAGQRPDPSDLAFILTGNPNNPDGGLLTRFPGFYIPFLDASFTGVTPPNSPYPTYIYTGQYDGIADTPQYPLNVVSDLNAFAGYFFVHNTYPLLTPPQVANAQPLPTSPGYTGNTQYYMLLTQDVPLLDPIRDIPFVGPPIADLVQPDLRVIVDMGYGNLAPGADYANIPTPASFDEAVNLAAVHADLVTGASQGVQAALVDIGLLPQSELPDAYPYLPSVDPGLSYSSQPDVTALSVLSGELGSALDVIPRLPFT